MELEKQSFEGASDKKENQIRFFELARRFHTAISEAEVPSFKSSTDVKKHPSTEVSNSFSRHEKNVRNLRSSFSTRDNSYRSEMSSQSCNCSNKFGKSFVATPRNYRCKQLLISKGENATSKKLRKEHFTNTKQIEKGKKNRLEYDPILSAHAADDQLLFSFSQKLLHENEKPDPIQPIFWDVFFDRLSPARIKSTLTARDRGIRNELTSSSSSDSASKFFESIHENVSETITHDDSCRRLNKKCEKSSFGEASRIMFDRSSIALERSSISSYNSRFSDWDNFDEAVALQNLRNSGSLNAGTDPSQGVSGENVYSASEYTFSQLQQKHLVQNLQECGLYLLAQKRFKKRFQE